jgi:hypothetical protein
MMHGLNCSPHCVVSEHETTYTDETIRRNEAIVAGQVMRLPKYNDKRKTPETMLFRPMTEAEVRALRPNQWVSLLSISRLVYFEARVTSVKTWKTRESIEVKCVFGLKEFFTLNREAALARLLVPMP